MTERLTALLNDEAQGLDVPPPPPTRDLLSTGRSLRRRHRVVQSLTAAAVVAVIGVGAAFAFGGFPDRAADDNRADAPSGSSGAAGATTAVDGAGLVFAAGKTLYLDGGTTSVTMDEIVQQIYYTSAGLLLRTNKTGDSDGGAPFHFALVAPDGTVTKLGLTLGEVVPSTDPAQPYLAYGDVSDGVVQVVVLDLTTGKEAARVDLPRDLTWGGWTAPPVALSGDQVYVGFDDTARVVNWRTGEVTTTDAIAPGFPSVSGGRAVVSGRTEVRVVDATSGATLLSVSMKGYPWAVLSSDGHYAKVSDQLEEQSIEVYDVDSGTHVTLAGQAFDYGWTTDGGLFRVSGDTIETCAPTTGECSSATLPDGLSFGKNEMVRLGGQVFES